MEVIKTSDFVSHDHSCHLTEGLWSYVDVARLLLELNTIVKSIAKGNFANFRVPETSLYVPLQEVFNSNLPSHGFVNIENLLYKTDHPRQKTDISLSKITQLNKARLAKDLECTHFVEIKSIFRGESISISEVEKDLNKLLACELAYDAVCFFVLVGLEDELFKQKTSLSGLGVLGENVHPFQFHTSGGKSIWLRPAGQYKADNPFVFVWEVSASNKFKNQNRSGCSFSVFQGQPGKEPNLSFHRACAKPRAASDLCSNQCLSIHRLKSLYNKWINRKKYKAFSEMPDWLVVFFALSGFLVAGFYGYVLSMVVPDYLKTANNISLSEWGWTGWLLFAMLSALGFTVWHFGSVAWRCNGILRDRWYK